MTIESSIQAAGKRGAATTVSIMRVKRVKEVTAGFETCWVL
jgi:hypothetical protein